MQFRATTLALITASVPLLACSQQTNDVSQKSQRATLCGTWEHIDVLGKEYVINNNVWNGDGQCIEASSGSTAFEVVQASHNKATNGAPASYPSIYRGCHWGDCTPESGLPVQTSSVPAINSSWDVSTPNSGAYNVAYDLWFDSSPSPSSQPNEAELMIWIDHHGGPRPFGNLVGTVNLEGATWEIWQGPMDGWTYIAYRRTTGTNSVDLDLSSFINDATGRGYIDPNSYLVTIEAGFEIWQGGQGLRQNSFSASVGGTPGGGDSGGNDGSDGGGSDGGSTGGTCEATYEAENMTASTGGSISGGWNLWSNGSLSTSHDFAPGPGDITVVAKGESASGVWPTLTVSVGGNTIGSTTVDASNWTSYTFDADFSGGAQDISVAFTNDYYDSGTGADRNLHVDHVSVACGDSGGTASCSDGIQNQNETDVDCGGSCSTCADGQSCSTGSDCASNTCNAGTCQAAASCFDGIQNQDETDVDCGGSCSACADGQSCSTGSDCASDTCNSGTCEAADSGDGEDGSDGSGTDGGSSDVSASLSVSNEWSTGYCADLTVSSDVGISAWSVAVDTNDSTIYNSWNANFDGGAPSYTVTPFDWNASLGAGGSVSVGFCANKSGSNWQPEVVSTSGN